MPGMTIKPNTKVAYLGILDEDGEVDEQRLPDIEDDQLLAFHHAMLRAPLR